MTDLLDRTEDTGEIPRPVDPGMTTQRLHVDEPTGPLHTIRRSPIDDTEEQPLYWPTTIGLVDPARRVRPAAVEDLIAAADFQPPQTPPPGPDPVPPPPPPTPTGEILWDEIVGTGEYLPKRSVLYVPSAGRKPGPRGAHRRPSRWGWLTTPLLGLSVDFLDASTTTSARR